MFMCFECASRVTLVSHVYSSRSSLGCSALPEHAAQVADVRYYSLMSCSLSLSLNVVCPPLSPDDAQGTSSAEEGQGTQV